MDKHLTGGALLTDLYQLTMASAYLQSGKAWADACFYVSFRELPFAGGYAIACGMEHVARLIEDFRLSDDDIEYLRTLPAPDKTPLFSEGFLRELANMRLELDIDAVSEGTAVFPNEPLLRVMGPVLQCQLVETAILNAINFETLVATKAARIVSAAKGPVAEFGLRRAQGPAGAIYASRAAIVGGCSSTSNCLAGKMFGLPVSGTHAHSWVMAFPSELEAFRAYAQAFAHNCTLLVDTYDVISGVKNAIIVAREMESQGERLAAIRIDSGDLAWLANRSRELLDAAGLDYVKIVASNDLDEYTITSLLHEQEAAIDAWGVGTRLACCYDQPSLGGVYKMSALREPGQTVWQPKMKLSAQLRKSTLPGLLQVRRYYNSDGIMIGDMVYSEKDAAFAAAPAPPAAHEHLIIDPFDDLRQKDLAGNSYETLLRPLVRDGKALPNLPDAMTAKLNTEASLKALDASNKRLLNPHSYPVGLSCLLHQTREQMIRSFK